MEEDEQPEAEPESEAERIFRVVRALEVNSSPETLAEAAEIVGAAEIPSDGPYDEDEDEGEGAKRREKDLIRVAQLTSLLTRLGQAFAFEDADSLYLVMERLHQDCKHVLQASAVQPRPIEARAAEVDFREVQLAHVHAG